MAEDPKNSAVELIEPIAEDAERLVDLHAELLGSEIKQMAGEVSPALLSLGAGAGLAAAGGLLGSLMLVHGLNRATRLPLWGCYGLVGGLLGAAGVSLMGAGSKRLSGVSLIPHETLATLKDDLQWIRRKTT